MKVALQPPCKAAFFIGTQRVHAPALEMPGAEHAHDIGQLRLGPDDVFPQAGSHVDKRLVVLNQFCGIYLHRGEQLGKERGLDKGYRQQAQFRMELPLPGDGLFRAGKPLRSRPVNVSARAPRMTDGYME